LCMVVPAAAHALKMALVASRPSSNFTRGLVKTPCHRQRVPMGSAPVY
jgi:hypothetical protein